MGKQYFRNHARANLSSPRRFDTEPVTTAMPTISVKRPIIWQSPDQQQQHLNVFHDALRTGLNKNQKRRFDITDPNAMSLVQVRQSTLATRALELHSNASDREQKMERLAYLLQGKLHELLLREKPQLQLPIGSVACVRELAPTYAKHQPEHEVVGLIPDGWRGPKKKYPANDCNGNSSALRLLAAENSVFVESLYQINGYFNPKEILADPYVAVVAKNPYEKEAGIRPGDFDKIRSSLTKADAIPEYLTIGDPVIEFHSGQWGEVLQLPVRDLGSARQAAA